MFIPMFIAILLGLVTPTNTNNNCTHGGTTVSASNNTAGDPGDPGDGSPGDDTGGDTGNNPPR